MNRQEFLKSIALTGVAATIGLDGSEAVLAQRSRRSGKYDLVAVMGGEPGVMFDKGIAQLGGMERFVKKGDRVVIKPNIGWDAAPERAANTNPDLIVAMIKAAQDAGAKEVAVFDHTCDSWQNCYRTSGMDQAVKEAGATLLPGNEREYYVEVELPKGKKLKSALIHKAIVDCDVWFNVPILKTHGGAKMTIAMKNHMGIVWDRQFFHQNNLQQCIADICTYTKPAALQIVDAYRVMQSNGPRGRSINDAVLTKALIMSTDIIAVDTAAVRFFNQVKQMPLDAVSHIANGQDLGLGTMDLGSLKIKQVKL